MKWRIMFGCTICVLIASAAFGMIKRQSYTDILKEENYLEQLEVAELGEELSKRSCAQLAEILPDAPIILRVTAVEDIEHLFYAGRQKVKIQEVYVGSGLKAGDEIYLTFDSWSISVDNSVQRGFINVLKKEYEYLAFISEEIDTLYETIPVYKLYGNNIIAPVFCYEDLQNVIVLTQGESTGVPYELVKDNEFFATTKGALEAWKDLKEKVLSDYPR